MSFSIRNIREISGDPLAKFSNELAKKLSRFLTKDQLEQLEDKEDVYTDGQDFDTVVRVHGDLLSNKTFNFDTIYYPPLEPDNDKLRLWIRGRNLGNQMTDWSTKDNTIELYGEPLLIDGTPFDDGTKSGGVKSTAVQFNRLTSNFRNQEYIRVIGTADTRAIDNLTTGISFFMRFRVYATNTQGGFSRTLFQKRDSSGSPPADGIRVMVTDDRRIRVRIYENTIQHNSQTATDTILTNTVYDMWVTYTVSGNVTHVYINNVDKTLTDPGSNTNWSNPVDDTDWYIFKHGGSAETNGHVEGDLYDFRIYREKVMTTTDISRMWTNKWTISNRAFGEVMISNYWATYIDLVGVASFTTTSFSSTSYNT